MSPPKRSTQLSCRTFVYEPLKIRERFGKQPYHRQYTDLLDAGFLRDQIEDTWCKPKLNLVLSSGSDHSLKKAFARNGVIGDDHFLDAIFANCLCEISELAQNRDTLRISVGNIALNNTNDSIAQVLAFSEFFNDR